MTFEASRFAPRQIPILMRPAAKPGSQRVHCRASNTGLRQSKCNSTHHVLLRDAIALRGHGSAITTAALSNKPCWVRRARLLRTQHCKRLSLPCPGARILACWSQTRTVSLASWAFGQPMALFSEHPQFAVLSSHCAP